MTGWAVADFVNLHKPNSGGILKLVHSGLHGSQCCVSRRGCYPTHRRAARGLTTRNGRFGAELGMGTGGFQCRPLQLPLIVRLQNILERGDGIEQIAVPFYASLGGNGSGFCADKALALKGGDVFCRRVFRHAHCFADGFVAGPALARFSVGTAEQIGVDGQFAGAEPENEDLVGEGECVL